MANNDESRPQFFPNDLKPVPTDENSLRSVLEDLRAAVRRGVEIIRSQCPAPESTENEDAFGNIFSGSLGIALMFLRLDKQANALSDIDEIGNTGNSDPPLPDFRTLMKPYIGSKPLELASLQPGRSSPLCSPSLSSLVLRILAAQNNTHYSSSGPSMIEDVTALRESIQVAIKQERTVTRNGHSMGVDEVLYGRAGLLGALASIDAYADKSETRQTLLPALKMKLALRKTIIEAGKSGAEEYAQSHGVPPVMPLMWPWLNSYYGLGAMHGISGILTVLLECEPSHSDCRDIAHTITALCKLCISQNGHLPMSVPPWPSSRPSPLVQICHGSPGLLVLLAAAKRSNILRAFRSVEWDEAIRLGSERMWEEGLLSKGGGLCHGISGNAWPWLLLHEAFAADGSSKSESISHSKIPESSRYEGLSADYFLSRALAFLLAARETPPFLTDSRYRIPDNPFSLFEGLAGTICAWAEACAVITARLRLVGKHAKEAQRQVYEEGQVPEQQSDVLGFLGLGGIGTGSMI